MNVNRRLTEDELKALRRNFVIYAVIHAGPLLVMLPDPFFGPVFRMQFLKRRLHKNEPIPGVWPRIMIAALAAWLWARLWLAFDQGSKGSWAYDLVAVHLFGCQVVAIVICEFIRRRRDTA